MDQDATRFRSFAERYVIERASTFRQGAGELEDAWLAVERAKTLYKHIAEKSKFTLVPDAAEAPDEASRRIANELKNAQNAKIAEDYRRGKAMQPWAIDPTRTRRKRSTP